jgi:hypothetical protein
MDERNQTPNITFVNTCAETLRFWGAGVQHVEYVVHYIGVTVINPL